MRQFDNGHSLRKARTGDAALCRDIEGVLFSARYTFFSDDPDQIAAFDVTWDGMEGNEGHLTKSECYLDAKDDSIGSHGSCLCLPLRTAYAMTFLVLRYMDQKKRILERIGFMTYMHKNRLELGIEDLALQGNIPRVQRFIIM